MKFFVVSGMVVITLTACQGNDTILKEIESLKSLEDENKKLKEEKHSYDLNQVEKLKYENQDTNY